MARGLSPRTVPDPRRRVPFFTHASAVERLRGVVAGLDGSRYDLVLFNVESAAPPRRAPRRAHADRGRADGAPRAVPPGPPPGPRPAARHRQCRSCWSTSRRPGVPSVVTDDVEGGRMATHLLLSLGHRRSGSSATTRATRSGSAPAGRASRATSRCSSPRGWRAGAELRRYGTARAGRGPSRRRSTSSTATAGRPTAVFAASDVQAIGVLAAATDRRPPRARRPVGDRLRRHRAVRATLGLTTVRQPLFESGRLGVELLLAHSLADPTSPPRGHELPLELVRAGDHRTPARARSKR